MNEKILLSIITINYNNSSGLDKTIQSVLDQNFKDFEYLIIDGGSIDGSIDVIKKYEKNIDYWISEKDNGIYHAMNKGIEKAKGEYLMFLNSGDSIHDNEVLEKCFKLILELPKADIYYGDMFLIEKENSKPARLYKHPEQLDLNYFKDKTINHQASLINAQLFCELGMYPDLYQLASDYWFYLKAFLCNKEFRYLGLPMINYDWTGVSMTNNKSYKEEHFSIWKELVPGYVRKIINENADYRNRVEPRLVKYAIAFNNVLRKLKSRRNNHSD